MKTINVKNGIKSILLLLVVAIFSLGFSLKSFAADELDVEYKPGTNLNGRDIFDEDKIYPGWSESKKISIENDSDDEVDLYMRFDLDDGKTLADLLKLYVIRDSDDSYRVGGSGDRYTLEEADDEGWVFIEKLDAREEEEYKIKFKLPSEVGNETQRLSSLFDIDFKIEQRESDGRTETEILAYYDRVVTGEAPEDEIEEITEETTEEIEVAGDSADSGENIVKGAESECYAWPPRWVWILAMIIVIVGFVYNDHKNYKKEEREIKYRWAFDLILLIVAVLFWWIFDKCRIYLWFLYGSIIAGVVVHGLYAWFLSKKAERGSRGVGE